MTANFDAWWDSDFPGEGNPYRKASPAYWAWLGWQAGKRHEREECAKVCEGEYEAADCVAAIRARGEA